MKFGSYIKFTEEFGENIDASSYFGWVDKNIYEQGYKRVGPIKVRQGLTDDDFVRSMYTIVFTAIGYRIPRILNPLYNKSLKKCQINLPGEN